MYHVRSAMQCNVNERYMPRSKKIHSFLDGRPRKWPIHWDMNSELLAAVAGS